MKKIWLIGGTQESVDCAQVLVQANRPCVITVTTDAARSLYSFLDSSPHDPCEIQVRRSQATEIRSWIQAEAIGAILDASHPFAVEISQLAIGVAQDLSLPYLRFERSSVPSHPDTPHWIQVNGFEQLLTPSILDQERVLLTVGYRPLHLFQPWHDRATLFARILPSPTALAAALAAGFSPDRLIALRPPIGPDLERALWQQWQISVVVTKASGQAGGETTKQQVAQDLGIKLITITRPSMPYPQQTSDLATVRLWVWNTVGSRDSYPVGV